MRSLFLFVAGLSSALPSPIVAAAPIGAEMSITKYCEPLISGQEAAKVSAEARKDGFKNEMVGGHSVLRMGSLFVSVSDAPRVCLVQAPSDMTFDQGVALIDGWAGHHPGAVKSPATRGPDGSPVRAWTSIAQKRSLILSQQGNALGQKVLAFILMPLPPGSN